MILHKFEASWCGHCKEIQRELDAKNIKVDHVDIDEHPDLMDKYNLIELPTIIAEQDGVIVARWQYSDGPLPDWVTV